MSSEKDTEWLQLVIGGTDPISATKAVFDCTKTSTISSKTSQLKLRYADDIHKSVMDNLVYFAPHALNTIKEIAENATQDAVKLKACQDLLSRAGYDATQVHEIKTPLTPEQLQGRINAIIEKDPLALTNLLSMVDTKPKH